MFVRMEQACHANDALSSVYSRYGMIQPVSHEIRSHVPLIAIGSPGMKAITRFLPPSLSGKRRFMPLPGPAVLMMRDTRGCDAHTR